MPHVAWMRRLALVLAVVQALVTGIVPATAAEESLALDRPLTFVDADGAIVRSSDFRGQWLLVYFGYTHCADLCPTGLTVLVNALDQIGPAAAYIQPLFVTVDPERDKGPLLRIFTQSFDKRLIGLGGSADEIRQAATALGVTFQKTEPSGQKTERGAAGYAVDHSASYTLVDPRRTRAVVLKIAEPHLLAAALIAALTKAGVPLGNVNNAGAYR